jgi:hypothetical protein
MSIDRDADGIAFTCDNCGEVDDTQENDFQTAVVAIQMHGWTIRKKDGEWEHFCRTCNPNKAKNEFSKVPA